MAGAYSPQEYKRNQRLTLSFHAWACISDHSLLMGGVNFRSRRPFQLGLLGPLQRNQPGCIAALLPAHAPGLTRWDSCLSLRCGHSLQA